MCLLNNSNEIVPIQGCQIFLRELVRLMTIIDFPNTFANIANIANIAGCNNSYCNLGLSCILFCPALGYNNNVLTLSSTFPVHVPLLPFSLAYQLFIFLFPPLSSSFFIYVSLDSTFFLSRLSIALFCSFLISLNLSCSPYGQAHYMFCSSS